MTDVSIDELLVFARYRRWKSGGVRARGVQRVLDLAPGCATADEVLALLGHDEPGDVRDSAIEFIEQFRAPVRDEYVDAAVRSRDLRDSGLPPDPETGHLASSATYKESFLAALITEADIRDAAAGMLRRLNAEDEANGRPPFSWLGRD
jgi:hypothetical protein